MTDALIIPAEAVRSWEYEADVAVVGAGGCGMVAALSAAELGAQVLLIDRDRKGACNTARSGGMIPAGGTRFQRAAGIAESPEDFALEILAKNGGQSPRDLAFALCRRAPELVHWLVDRPRVRLELVTDFKYPGHTEYRMHAPLERTGAALFAMLRDAVHREANIQVALGANGQGLVADRGAVGGVSVESGAAVEFVRARKVILALNGFGGNPPLVAQHIPEMAGVLYFGGEESTGEGIRWGQALGAATAFMDAYQAHASVAQPGGTLVSYAVIMQGGIQVNRLGRRFADETLGYSEHAVALARQPDRIAVEVFDQPIYDQALQFPDFRACVEQGVVKRATTVARLASLFGLPAAELARTVESYNAANRTLAPDEVGRRPSGRPLSPPLYAVQVTAALIHTQGGLVVNQHAQVVTPDGSPIPNLYAGGGVAAGISGHGPAGYLSGNGLLTALGYGRIAGEHCARALARERS